MLLEAVKNNDIECVKKALDNGENINIQDIGKNTALIWASYRKYTEIVKLLLENPEKTSINVNIQDNGKNTALIWVSKKGHTEIVKLLLENPEKTNIDVNMRNIYGETALIIALYRKHTEIGKLLLKHRKIKLYNILYYTQIKEILRRQAANPSKFLQQPKKEVKYYDKRF